MSNCCCTRVTSLPGSSPALVIPANSSNSLPKPQLPIFLPLNWPGPVIPLSFQATWYVPERAKIWPTSVIPAPCSREASALGTQATA